MDDKVRELMEKVRQAAKDMGNAAADTVAYAGKKTGEMVEAAKLNMQIFDLNTEIGILQKEIGQIVYATHTGGETDADVLNDKLLQIDEKQARIEEYKARIKGMKQICECPQCGCKVGKEDAYCRNCGAKISAEETADSSESCGCGCGEDENDSSPDDE